MQRFVSPAKTDGFLGIAMSSYYWAPNWWIRASTDQPSLVVPNNTASDLVGSLPRIDALQRRMLAGQSIQTPLEVDEPIDPYGSEGCRAWWHLSDLQIVGQHGRFHRLFKRVEWEHHGRGSTDGGSLRGIIHPHNETLDWIVGLRDPYVAFVNNPTRALRKLENSCLGFRCIKTQLWDGLEYPLKCLLLRLILEKPIAGSLREVSWRNLMFGVDHGDRELRRRGLLNLLRLGRRMQETGYTAELEGGQRLSSVADPVALCWVPGPAWAEKDEAFFRTYGERQLDRIDDLAQRFSECLDDRARTFIGELWSRLREQSKTLGIYYHSYIDQQSSEVLMLPALFLDWWVCHRFHRDVLPEAIASSSAFDLVRKSGAGDGFCLEDHSLSRFQADLSPEFVAEIFSNGIIPQRGGPGSWRDGDMRPVEPACHPSREDEQKRGSSMLSSRSLYKASPNPEPAPAAEKAMSTSKLRHLAEQELSKMQAEQPEYYQNLLSRYLTTLDEKSRELVQDIQTRMQATIFQSHIHRRLIRYMVENPADWGFALRGAGRADGSLPNEVN